MKNPLLILLAILFIFCSCKKKTNPNPEPIPLPASFFAKGADVSWVTQMESEGIKFYNKNGIQEDLFAILKDLGMNTIRLRAWINPADGWCNTNDVLTKAKRAQQVGFRILIDFHYSDSWADPGQQNKPAAWQGQDINQLAISVSNYTKSVLEVLKQNNIAVDWVQVGNETNDGMLWPEGKASSNMAGFASLINAGYDAVKIIYPSAKVIVHISNGFDNALFRWIFDGLQMNNAKWDVIGMSLYPSSSNWQELNTKCLSNMNDMVARYNKEVMICEVGMPVADSLECKNFIADLISKTRYVANGKGLGVLYWEPECYNNWKGYGLGVFGLSGQPTMALDGFK